MLKLFAAFKKEFGVLIAYIVVVSMIAGNTGGIVAALINRSARQAVTGTFDWRGLLWLSGALAVFLVARREALRKGVYFAERAMEIYRRRVVTLLRQADVLELERIGEADICVRLTEDAGRVAQALARSVRVLQALIAVLFFLAYITWLYHGATLFLLAFTGLGVVLYLIVSETLNTANHDILARETEVFTLAQEMLQGFKELKLAPEKQADLFDHDLRPRIDRLTQTRIHFKNLLSNIQTTAHLLHYLALGSIVLLFPPEVSMPVRFEVLAVTLVMSRYIKRFYTEFPVLARAGVAFERLQQLEGRLQRATAAEGAETAVLSSYLVDFETLAVASLRFDHTDAAGNLRLALGPLDFAIRAGELVFLTGGNGSGKTTFLKVLMGLYPALSGSFTINQEPVTIAAHRSLFATVFTDEHLFQRLYGLETVDPQAIRQLLNKMGLAQTTQWRKGRFTNLHLSAGQRKRLALIGALLEDKPIYVLDEWAAEQDPEFRAYFYEDLLPELKKRGKAVLVVTQDERYFHVADRVLKMRDGQFVEGEI